MNIFQKIKIFNKFLKIIKETKNYFNSTHLDEEMKEIITNLKTNFEKLIKKAPELKDAYLFFLGMLK